jgi:hypothetical protein
VKLFKDICVLVCRFVPFFGGRGVRHHEDFLVVTVHVVTNVEVTFMSPVFLQMHTISRI